MVVGGCGFIGSQACRLLAEKNFQVISYDLGSPPERAQRPGGPEATIQYVTGDILDVEAIADAIRRFGVAGMVHTVAAGNEAQARENPDPAITLNVQGTLKLLEAARRTQVKKFVYISTAGVYGRRVDRRPIKEDEPITWRGTIYHPSHYMGEILVEMYHEVYGLDTVTLRPLAVYGPSVSSDKRQHLQAKSLFFGSWILKGLKGEEVEIKGADTQSDITYVKDVASAVFLAYSIESSSHRVFNISSGVLVSHRQVAETIGKYLPSARFRFVPGVQENPLRPTQGPLDISRAKEDLRFIPQYTLDRGIKEYVGWVKNESATSEAPA